MRFLLSRWRGVGTRLYLALAFAVMLTLVSSAVGVYYFERSGDLNYQAESESVPVLEASWEVSREAERLRGLGLELLSGTAEVGNGEVGASVARLQEALALPNGVPVLAENATKVDNAAYGVADSIDALILNHNAMLQADAALAGVRQRMAAIPADSATSVEGLRLLGRALRAENDAALDEMQEEFKDLALSGLEAPIVEVGGGDGVFAVRRQHLLLMEQRQDLTASFGEASADLEASAAALLDGARAHSSSTLGGAVESFDQGRVLLAVISIVSVVAATLTAWLWVGNAVVRRLSALSERMRRMVSGDLETPVPEIGRDEIGNWPMPWNTSGSRPSRCSG